MSNGAYGEQALELLGQFFENAGINATKLETEPAYSIVLGGDHGLMPAMAGLLMDRHQFITYVAAPSTCPADRRAAVAEFVARANWGLPMGNFELDMDDGSVRFKSSVDYENVGLTQELVRNTFAPAAFTMDRYLEGLLAVMYGSKAPADIIHAIESDSAGDVG